MKRAMKYTIGYSIPAEEILKRFKDEDGETFLEVRGLNELLFRVTDGDRIYYKIEKSKMKGEELTLVEDYTMARPKSFSFQDVPTAKHRAVPEVEETDLDMDNFWGLADGHKPEVKLEEIDEFEEGQSIPEPLRAQCRKNDYGGYSFRYNKFLYLLDSTHCVEIKSPDTASRYALEESLVPSGDPVGSEISSEILTLTDLICEPEEEAEPEKETEIELQPGDILPAHLRTQCESQLGYGYDSRIIIGHYLYHLNPGFKVLKKMKISYEDEEVSAGSEAAPAAAEPEPGAVDKADTPVEVIIARVVGTLQKALDLYQISADYFKETVLGPGNREILIRVYQGDLEGLNDDTREASAQGKKVTLAEEESGLDLLKAALIHELYIKSTVSGRGEKMKYFLTQVAAIRADGTVGELQDDLALEDQKKGLEFFKDRANVYTDKIETIKRIHLQLRFSLLEEYKELWLSKENVRFNAMLIARLYENTTRLDRGDGITMIRLTRDLLGSAKN